MKKSFFRATVLLLILAILLPCVFAGTEMVTSIVSNVASGSLDGVVIDGGYVKNIPNGTIANELVGCITGASYITKSPDYRIAEASRVGTGYKLVMSSGATYTLLVDGDLDGDSYTTGKDLVRAKKYLLSGKYGVYESLLDFNGNGTFDEDDLSDMAEHIITDEPEFDISEKPAVDLGDDFYATIDLSYVDHSLMACIGGNVVASEKSNTANQIWHFQRHFDGSYVIENVGMGDALELSYANTDYCSNVSVYTTHRGENQRWHIVEYEGGYLFNSLCGYDRVIDIFGASTDNEANACIYGVNYTPAQIFYINKVDDIDTSSDAYFDQVGPLNQSSFYGNLSFGNTCIGSEGGSNVCLKTIKQYWHFELQSDGTYKITNATYDKVLDIDGAKMENGANIQLYSSNDTSAQRWYIYMKDGKAILRSAVDENFVVDVHGANDTEGCNIHLYKYNGTPAQQFTFVDYTVTLPTFRVSCPYNSIVYGRYNTLEEAKAATCDYLGQVVYNLAGQIVYNPCPSLTAAKLLHNAKLIADFAAANGFTYGHAEYNPGYNWQHLDITRYVVHDKRHTSCDRFVDWALWRTGFTDARGNKITNGPVVSEQVYWIPTLGFQKITNNAALKPGDIVFTTYDSTKPGLPYHVFICASNNMGGNTYLRYDHGSNARISYRNGNEYANGKAPFLEGIPSSNPTFYYAYRPVD